MFDATKRGLKRGAGAALFRSGLYRLLLRGKAVIVAFHSIDATGSGGSISVSHKLFREYCDFFSRYFEVVTLSSLVEDLKAGRDVSGKLVITFDDGYKDNHTLAAPALEKYGLPATFFVTTDFIGSDHHAEWDKEEGVKSEWMTWEDVRDLHERGFEIGSHTASHIKLATADAFEVEAELRDASRQIEMQTGAKVKHFAYPFGRREDIDSGALDAIHAAGFDSCVSCFGGTISKQTQDVMPRIPVNAWYQSVEEFGLELFRERRASGGEYGSSIVRNQSVLIVSYHLYPDTAVGAKRPSELAKFLVRKGYRVTALGGRPDKKHGVIEDGDYQLREMRTVRIIQPPSIVDWLWKHAKAILRRKSRHPVVNTFAQEVDSSDENGMSRLALVLRWLARHFNAIGALFDGKKWWAMFSVVYLSFERMFRRYDMVISSSPPSAGQLVGRLAASLNQCPYVMDFRDPWVGNIHRLEDSSSRIRDRLEAAAESFCISRAELLVSTTPNISRNLKTRYPNARATHLVIYNGYDNDTSQPLEILKPRMDMLYAGSLYLNRNPFPLLEGLKNFLDRNCERTEHTTLQFVGNCNSWNGIELRPRIHELGLSNVVRISGMVSPQKVERLMSESTVLVNLSQGQPDQIPAKTFDYIGSRKPMLVLAEPDSAVADLVSKIALGFVVDPSTGADAVSSTLEKIWAEICEEGSGRISDSGDVGQFSREAQLSILEQSMMSIESPQTESRSGS